MANDWGTGTDLDSYCGQHKWALDGDREHVDTPAPHHTLYASNMYEQGGVQLWEAMRFFQCLAPFAAVSSILFSTAGMQIDEYLKTGTMAALEGTQPTGAVAPKNEKALAFLD